MSTKLSRFKEFFTKKIRNRYRLIIRNDQNLEERISIVLTPLNLILILSGALVIFTTVVILLLPSTPLGGLLPGANDVNAKNMNSLQHRLDSLERKLRLQEERDSNLYRILKGDGAFLQPTELEFEKKRKVTYASFFSFTNETDESSGITPTTTSQKKTSYKRHYVFFTPLKGMVADTFNMRNGHTAIDIVSYSNAAVKATLDGTVVLSSWTPETGYVLVLQHPNNLISVYKHNSTLLKKQGTVVSAGEVIALIGNSGELTSGPHLHFELWQNGNPVNPAEYMVF